MKHVRHSQTISYSCNCNLRKREKIKNGTKAICEETTDDTFTKVREKINLEIQEIRGILRRKTQKKTTSRHTNCLAQSNCWDKGDREKFKSSQRGGKKHLKTDSFCFRCTEKCWGWGKDGKVSNLELRIYQTYPLKMNTEIGLISSGPGAKNPLCNAGHKGLIPGPGKSHMLWSNWIWAPQILTTALEPQEPHFLSPHVAATEARMPWSLGARQEKSPRPEALAQQLQKSPCCSI